MKYKILFCLLLLVCITTQAQSDLFRRSTALPALNTPTGGAKNNSFSIPSTSTSIPSTVIKSNTNYNENRFLLPEKPKDIGFLKKNQFENPGDQVKEKLNKAVNEEGGMDMTIFRRNQYLGDFRNNGKHVNVKYRDHMFVDGDMIRIWVNDKVVAQQITLSANFQGFDLPLVAGFNKIEFEAINEGSSGPNTAEFNVYDDKGILISADRWDLATGFKASVIIVKE